MENFSYELRKGTGNEYRANNNFITLIQEIINMFMWLREKIEVDEADQREKFLEQYAQTDNKF